MPFDENVTEHYGLIRAELEKKGLLIGPLNMMIAAHACYLNSILATNNVKEFLRVPGLRVEAWS